MSRGYLRVTPTTAGLDPDVVSTAIASLHKLSATEPDGVIARLTPSRSEQPVTFEFVAISDGTNEPVEFNYGTDTKLDVLQQRLRSTGADSGESDPSHAYLTEKTRLLTARVDELEATIDRKNERIKTLEAEIERLEGALAAGNREPGDPQDVRTVDADEVDDEAEEASVWDRTKQWFGSGAT